MELQKMLKLLANQSAGVFDQTFPLKKIVNEKSSKEKFW